MKFTYEFIKENIRIYQETKKQLPIISDFENGDVTYNAMRNVGLDKFAEFFNFQRDVNKQGFSLIQALTYKELKEIIITKTQNERFKTLLKNKSLKSFKKLIEEDSQTFDRLINGRWLRKPGYNNRGRRSWGRRSNLCVEGFDTAFIPLLNWIISNEIDTCENSQNDIYKKFSSQDKYVSRLKWYTGVQLSMELVPQKEIEVTHKLISSLVDFIDGSNIDFRKLNSDFIIDTLQNKIRKLITVPDGTIIRSKCDTDSSYGQNRLIEGKDYIVEGSSISAGFLRVAVTDESGLKNWYDYRLFEDLSTQRDLLLTQLGII